ncbi:MAG: flagellar hook assembly protein FlgD [Spirochaetaceae bacterium]|nr:MAG: flagellar hook assembly protein FlgD [Spirochaetaceae bacterium]
MDLSMTMTATDRARVESQADAFNRALSQAGQAGSKQELGRDDFLKILLTQLQNQDPTNPMEDREFIAQMAQFSTLEQMTNVARGFRDLSSTLTTSQALSVLGRTVEIRNGAQLETGVVSAVTRGATPQLTVNNREYDFSAIERIIQ